VEVPEGGASVTIYDVARAAGVAPSTVSRTFAKPGRVSEATARRVRQMAEELGYRSRMVGGPPASAATKVLAVIVADVTNPFYSQLVRGAQIAAAEAGYEVMLADTRESAVRERAGLERLIPLVDGLLIGGSRMPDSAIRTIAKQKPTVVVNRALGDVPSIVGDYRGGMRQVVELLASLGHASLLYAAGPRASWADGVRSRAVLDQGEELGIRTRRTGPFLPTFEGGLSAAETLVGRPATAIVAYNDLMAAGIMHGLLRAGVAVPGQVSVVGFDDILVSRLITPALTTVAVPVRQMGSAAATNLIAMAHGAVPQGGRPILLPTKLIVRASTGPVRGLFAA
jgi:LacI family transcriptional regulator